jgi:uncharacterized protein YkwD
VNWVDILVVLVVALYAIHGWRRGFIILVIEMIGFAVTMAVPWIFYREFTPWLQKTLNWSYSFAKAGSFSLLWLMAGIIYAFVARKVYKMIPQFIRRSMINRAAGAIPSMIKGLVLVALVLTLIVVIPSEKLPRKAVLDSMVGSEMVKYISAVERVAANVFSDAIQDTLTFLTVEPKPTSSEKVQLKFKTTDVSVDNEAEKRMLALVNMERRKRGLNPLRPDPKLTAVARAHSKDMFKRGYFAHVNPDGATPFNRMKKAGIRYMSAGENLALAPNVEIAHKGLMKSPGHRQNILSPAYKKVGIGAVENDVYGVMFSQEFTN